MFVYSVCCITQTEMEFPLVW